MRKKLHDNHVSGKFRGAAHWDWNINFPLTKSISVIFHNLRGYDSHLIFNELDKFAVKISVIPNGLEKYVAFFLNKILVFIDSMQFMNSNLNKLVKNLTDEDFKYLVEEFGSENLKLLKQKGNYPYEYMSSFARKYLFSSTKKGQIGNDGQISDGYISVKDYLTCEKNLS